MMENDRITTFAGSRYTCRQVEQHLDSYLEGELSMRDRLRLEHHLQNCERCGGLVADLRHIIQMAATLANQPVPAGVSARLRNRLQQETGVRFNRPRADLSLVK